ncbi:MAG: hypothetical protein QXR17_07785 [Candidatus Bathyarchaeia archaeon]
MGKYPNSRLHDWFSDWHYRRCAKNAHLTDIDRLWVELRRGRIVAAFDLKLPGDSMTHTEEIVACFLEAHRIPYYEVYVFNDGQPPIFQVKRFRSSETLTLAEPEMIAWINSCFRLVPLKPKPIEKLHDLML